MALNTFKCNYLTPLHFNGLSCGKTVRRTLNGLHAASVNSSSSSSLTYCRLWWTWCC